MIIVVLLFSAVHSRKKPDFGALTACVNKNQSLTIDCYYPPCDNTTFYCNLYDDEKGTLIGSSYEAMVNNNLSFYATSDVCRLIIKDHAKIYHNQTKTYVCALSRRKSHEKKTLVVKYTGKERPKDCPGSGPLLHVSKLLWLMAIIFFQETYL